MIYERIENFLEVLIEQTKNGNIEWKPMSQYEQEVGATDKMLNVLTMLHGEFDELHADLCFYFKHNDGVVMIIDETQESGKDGSKQDVLYMLIQCDAKSSVQRIDYPGMKEDIMRLQAVVASRFNEQYQIDKLYQFMTDIMKQFED